MFTYETAQQMSTEDLYSMVSDWFKDVHGIRPHWVAVDDREFFLDFIQHELDPEVQAIREQQEQYEQAIIEADEWQYARNDETLQLQVNEQTELAAVYPQEWDWYEAHV